MSKRYTENVKCINCGFVSDFIVWESLNSVIDPDASKRLLSGDLFCFECPKCKATRNVSYGMLYHRMDKHVLIHFCQSDKNYNEMLQLYSSNDAMLADMDKDNYIYRIVRNQNSLREKAILLEEGLDDRVIEIVKLFLTAQFPSNAGKISEVLFHSNDNGSEIVFITEDNKTLSTTFDMNFYNIIKERFHSYFPVSRMENLEVDQQFALNVFSKLPIS